jgi:hypothetical protein
MAGKRTSEKPQSSRSFGQGWPLCAALILVLAAGQDCRSQEFAVRLLDFRNGYGIKNHSIWLQGYDESGALIRIERRTDVEGVALFRPRGNLRGEVAVSATDLRCGGSAVFTTDQLQNGVVERANCKARKQFQIPVLQPGKVILLGRPRPVWERILAPLERE